MKNEDIQCLAKHYVELGADMIDVGMVAGENRSRRDPLNASLQP